ncbi:MAG: sigma-54-dependent Fis family transcriptional regulator [Myxococcales bacterium]|nr:sigma-54-dependent Fis family transcriptional regulator [Myxococcales bacterium]
MDAERHGFAGRFHSPAIVRRVEQAVRTGRHLLIEGESGVGKELAARCAHVLGRGSGPFVAYNCARFATAEEAETTIFGVARWVFSGVEARAGLLEEAEGGTLYLDEVPNLPVRVQRSLLRFAEDGVRARIGETGGRAANVWLLLGTNRPVEGTAGDGTVAGDLAARTHRVQVPPLRSRRADVPGIFAACLGRACRRAGVDEAAVLGLFGADHFEVLALEEARDANVRFLEDVAAEVAARVGTAPAEERRAALAGVFARRLAGSPVLERFRRGEAGEEESGRAGSAYERHREEILAAYRDLGGNLSAVEEAMRKRGIDLHRRWIAVFLERWGVRIRKRRVPGSG